MRRLTKGTLITFLLLGLLANSYSQSVNNSAYNVFGIGSLQQRGLTAYRGMGFAALSSRPIDMINLKNPAAVNSVRGITQIFDTGLSFSRLNQRSNEATSASNSGGLTDLSLWFKTGARSGLVMGLEKFSDATYDILSTNESSSTENESRHLGTGGSSQFFITYAYSPWSNLHLGIKANFLFGNIKKSEVISINQPVTGLQIENTQSFAKSLIDAGIQYEVNLNSSKIILGSTWHSGGHTTINNEQILIGDTGFDIDSIVTEDKSDLWLPSRLGFGIGFQSRSWELNLDYEFENWSLNEDRDGFSYNDREMISFGAQFIKDRYSSKFLERVALRFGSGWHASYIVIDEIDIHNQYYTLGLGIPINQSRASLNLSYQFQHTNLQTSQLIQENASTFSFSVIIRDIWFSKRAYN